MALIFLITTHSVLISVYLISNQQTSQFIPKVNWDKVTPQQFSCYNDFIAKNLPHLSTNVISYKDPTCVAHLPEIDSFLISLQQCLILASQNSFTYVNSSGSKIPFQAGMTLLVLSKRRLISGTKFGKKLVVLGLVYFIPSKCQVSLGLSMRCGDSNVEKSIYVTKNWLLPWLLIKIKILERHSTCTFCPQKPYYLIHQWFI